MATNEEVAAWSKTAADNNDADASINWSEGQTPGSVNNSARSMMAAIAKWRDDQAGALTLAGSVNAYTLTTNQGIDALADGIRIHFVPNLTNTDAATINVDTLGAKKLRKFVGLVEAALTAGDLVKDGHYVAQYDASADSATGAWIVLNPTPDPPAGLIWGLETSRNSVSVVDIAAGRCADDTNAVLLISTGTLSVDFGTTGANGLDTGSLANNTWYHVFVMGHTDGTIAGFGSTSLSPTLPTGYTWKRRVGSVKTNGSAQIIHWTQRGDHFLWTTEVTDRSSTTLSSSWALVTLTVPLGVRTRPLLSGFLTQANAGVVYIELSDGDQASTPTSRLYAGASFFASDGCYWNTDQLFTDTSSRIYHRTYVGSSTPTLSTNSIRTRGWVDTRGKLE